MKNYKIAVADTGYVGLSLGVLISQKHQVVAVNIVQAKVDMISNKKSIQNLQGDLRNNGQQLSDLKADHQSKAATPIYRYDCGRDWHYRWYGRCKLF